MKRSFQGRQFRRGPAEQRSSMCEGPEVWESMCSESCRWFVWLEGRREKWADGQKSSVFPWASLFPLNSLLILLFQARVMDFLAQFFKTVICIALYFHFFFTVTHAHYRKLKNTEKSIKNKGLKKKNHLRSPPTSKCISIVVYFHSIFFYFFIFSFYGVVSVL